MMENAKNTDINQANEAFLCNSRIFKYFMRKLNIDCLQHVDGALFFTLGIFMWCFWFFYEVLIVLKINLLDVYCRWRVYITIQSLKRYRFP